MIQQDLCHSHITIMKEEIRHVLSYNFWVWCISSKGEYFELCMLQNLVT
jgi:hypothetical protein